MISYNVLDGALKFIMKTKSMKKIQVQNQEMYVQNHI